MLVVLGLVLEAAPGLRPGEDHNVNQTYVSTTAPLAALGPGTRQDHNLGKIPYVFGGTRQRWDLGPGEDHNIYVRRGLGKREAQCRPSEHHNVMWQLNAETLALQRGDSPPTRLQQIGRQEPAAVLGQRRRGFGPAARTRSQ